MTIHAGILSSLPTDVTSLKLAAISFTGGIALIAVILLLNTVVNAASAALRPLGRRQQSSPRPNTLWGAHAACTRAVLPAFPWTHGADDSVAATSGISGLRPLGA
jgi:hypothetical protein